MGIGIQDAPQKCLECGRDCPNRRSLGNHLVRSHKELGGAMMYALKHLLPGQKPPLCACGCGKEAQWAKTAYRFNDYITGHNESGFRVKQPVFSEEQIKKRSETQRRLYASEHMKQKMSAIGKAVAERRKQEGFDPSEYFQQKWKCPEFRAAQHASRIESWKGEAGVERRKKVFTPEFAEKISAANMRRDDTKTSLWQKKFFAQIARIIPDLEADKWFNFTGKRWNADAWSPSLKLMFEFDGVFWHGLDRREGFKLQQFESMANDLVKNKLARDKSLTLIRLSENVDISSCTSLDDIIAVSYHYVKEGKVIKEGTFHANDDVKLLTRDYLLTTEKDWREKSLLPTLCAFLRAYVDYHGWFYPHSDFNVSNALEGLTTVENIDSIDRRSSMWLKSVIRSYWDVDGGPVVAFLDDERLRSVVKYRLGLNNSKPYSYTLGDGTTIQDNETFDVSFNTLRRGFIVQRNAVSWFQPSVAAHVFRTFLRGIDEPVVWDPSIGFSARLLGFASVVDKGRYVGTDPARQMIHDAELVKTEIVQQKPDLVIDLINEGSERFVLPAQSVDLVFTSPPYFDKEKWFDEPGQCWRDHPTIERWTKDYLIPTLMNAQVCLKSGARCVVNISEELVSLVEAAGSSAGLIRVFDEDVHMKLQSDHFNKSRGFNNQRHEPFIVFKKP